MCLFESKLNSVDTQDCVPNCFMIHFFLQPKEASAALRRTYFIFVICVVQVQEDTSSSSYTTAHNAVVVYLLYPLTMTQIFDMGLYRAVLVRV